MNITAVAAGAALLLGLAGAAQAADLMLDPLPAAPEEPSSACDPSFYAGIHGGYLWGDFDPDDAQFDPSQGSGFSGGVQAGVECKLGVVNLGLEGELTLANLDMSSSFDGSEGVAIVDYGFLGAGSLRARLGVDVNDQLTVFVDGGAALGVFDRDVSVFRSGALYAASPDNGTLTHWGWVLGIGARMNIDEHWSASAQYSHYDFGDDSYTVPVYNQFSEQSVHLSSDVISIGLNYRF